MSYERHDFSILARDTGSPYLRNRLWTGSFFQYPELLGVERIRAGIVSREDVIEYVVDLSTWQTAHEALVTKIEADSEYLEFLIDQSLRHGAEMNAWTEKHMFRADLTGLSGLELMSLLEEFIRLQAKEYAYGTAIPVLDYSNLAFVEGQIERILSDHVPPSKRLEYYATFTEPESDSFAREEEKDLLRLTEKYWDVRGWRESVRTKEFEELSRLYPEFGSELSKHAAQYAWIHYVFAGLSYTESDFLSMIADIVKEGIRPAERLLAFETKRTSAIVAKERLLKELEVDDFDTFILRIAGKVVWSKPRRKDLQSRSYYHAEKLLKEIGARLSRNLETIRSTPIDTLRCALEEKEVDWSMSEEIFSFHICLPNDDGTVTTLYGDEAREFSAHSIRRTDTFHDFSDSKEITGSTACAGEAFGRAKIVNTPEDMSKMEAGDILVSMATTPSIVPAMKKASAILTDEGGLTCHASIVSRELGIPCVVGLKAVTKFVSDGDRLEVDATRGIVRKSD